MLWVHYVTLSTVPGEYRAMNYRPPAHVKQMLEEMASEDRTHQTWLLNWLVEQEWARRGKPPVMAGKESDDATPDA